jgi:organic hydroperoxide reductase OsmC/OhrA
MQAFPHRYEVGLFSGPSGPATIASAGLPSLRSAPPREFDGPGDAWSPEHLLLASVETCFLFTFRAVARAATLDFTAIEMIAEGVVGRNGGSPRFVEITLRPRITLANADDRERAFRAVARAERACLVAASLATPVRVEPEIIVSSIVSVA